MRAQSRRMTVRVPVPDTSLVPRARRRPRHRGAGLAAVTLCLLAVLAGAVTHSAGSGHHHRPVLAVAAAVSDQPGTATRGVDLAASGGTAAEPLRVIGEANATHASAPVSTSTGPVRTRGPPATAG